MTPDAEFTWTFPSLGDQEDAAFDALVAQGCTVQRIKDDEWAVTTPDENEFHVPVGELAAFHADDEPQDRWAFRYMGHPGPGC